MNLFFPSIVNVFFSNAFFYKLLLLPFSLFFIGMVGLTLYRQNLLILLMAIELLLLSVNLFFVFSSLWFNDIIGQIFSIIILTVAAAESAIGLALIVIIYNLVFEVNLLVLSKLKG